MGDLWSLMPKYTVGDRYASQGRFSGDSHPVKMTFDILSLLYMVSLYGLIRFYVLCCKVYVLI